MVDDINVVEAEYPHFKMEFHTAVSIYQSINNEVAAHNGWNLSINLQYIDDVHENIMLVHICFVHQVLPPGI